MPAIHLVHGARRLCTTGVKNARASILSSCSPSSLGSTKLLGLWCREAWTLPELFKSAGHTLSHTVVFLPPAFISVLPV